MNGYVYLLKNREHNAFKIGRSIAPFMRSKQLPQEFDLAASLQVPVVGWKAEKVEGILHGLFRAHAVTMPYGDGYTEWFDLAVWDDVLTFLQGQSRHLGIGEPEQIPAPAMRASRRTAMRMSREDREAQLKTETIEDNQEQLNRLQEWLADATGQGQLTILGLLDNVPAEQKGWTFYPRLYLAGKNDALKQWCRTALTFQFSSYGRGQFPVATAWRRVDELAQVEIYPPVMNSAANGLDAVPYEESLLAPMEQVRTMLSQQLPMPALPGAERAKLLELHALFEAHFGQALDQSHWDLTLPAAIGRSADHPL